MALHLTQEQIDATVAALPNFRKSNGNIHFGDLGAALGIADTTAARRVKSLAEHGLIGFDPVLPGFRIAKVSSTLSADGVAEKHHVQQKPELGDPFVVPEGHIVKGVSALVDPDGRTIQQWIKTKEDGGVIDAVASLTRTFDIYDGKARLIQPPAVVDADLMTTYVIGDHHLGMYAHAQEAGEDYDLGIGEKLLLDTMTELVSDAPKSDTAVVLNLGDFFHMDNSLNRTEKSGNILDVDTRYGKVLDAGVALMIRCIELALQKHHRVIVRCLQGNHDKHSSLALAIALKAFFRSNPRVDIDAGLAKFWFFEFGLNMIGAHHGDTKKPAEFAQVMAAERPQMWGRTRFRYAYSGHGHHKESGGECGGVEWEMFQVLSPRDNYAASAGYWANRSMSAITHHRERGEHKRQRVYA